MIRGNRILRWPIFLAAILCTGLLSQWMRGAGSAAVPSVNVGGVVNNASYTLASPNVAPGTLAAVFGTDLTNGTSCLSVAGCFPSFDSAGRLGTTMSGAQVIVNGIPVPIFYAAPTQLGIQIPTDLTGTSATIRVTVGSQTSESRTISIDPFSPGLFTVTQDGKGAGAITHADGRVVNTSNPARPGEVIVIYATGLGQMTPAVPTGTLPRGTTTTLTTPTVIIDGITAPVQFSGLSGCCVGLNQINVMVPVNVHIGENISVVLNIGGRQSNIVTIATAAATSLTATPSSINFGDVPTGTQSTRTVTLSNIGVGSLTISQANVSGPAFTVSGLSLPLTLGSGQSTSFSVTFLPTAPGSAAGSVSIISDALNSPLFSLSGNGTSQLAITTNSLPDGRQSTLYNSTLAATGGPAPYSWTISAGSLPAGLTLAASTGVISGTPTSMGTSNFTVRVTDANSQTATKALSITINAPLAVTTTSLPDGTQDTLYNASVEATGGKTPYSWSIRAGSLPAGLTLAASTGVISGTPTSTGSSNFTLQITDANSQTATQALSITINAPLAVTTTLLPDGTRNRIYNAIVEATGGTTPYSWSIIAGSLPPGLTLAVSTGVISGTPISTGLSNFTVQVTDANFQAATKTLRIVILEPPSPPPPTFSIGTNSLPDGIQNASYTATLVATGGQTPYSWSIIAGTLPAGLTLVASTGVISGTPTGTGTSNFTVQVTDASSPTPQINTKSLSITVYLPLSITTNSLPSGSTIVPYNATLVATGGKVPYSWSIIAGTLPTGLTLAASTGVISGVPTAGGTFTFTVRVTETNSQTATKELSITLTPASVSLTWTASTSVVAGYNVYRGNVTGGPFTKINSTLITGSAYVDITIQRGQTYIYVVTAVNNVGVESLFSNEATAVVP